VSIATKNTIEQSLAEALKRFNEGKLDDALALAQQAVRTYPSAAAPRVILAELQCFAGRFETADQQLELAAQVEPSFALETAQFRQVVRAAAARDDFFRRGRMPSFLAAPSPEFQHRLRAAVACREGRKGDAREALTEADSLRRRVLGSCDGVPFDDFQDMDGLLGSVLEALTADGRYFWLGFDQLRELDFEPVRRPRDLFCRPCRMVTLDGTEGVVFVPVLYDGSAGSMDDSIRLARATDWVPRDDTAPIRGMGQRMWIAGERDVAILDVTHVRFGD
jgi:type VI secretion system protein ImpE